MARYQSTKDRVSLRDITVVTRQDGDTVMRVNWWLGIDKCGSYQNVRKRVGLGNKDEV